MREEAYKTHSISSITNHAIAHGQHGQKHNTVTTSTMRGTGFLSGLVECACIECVITTAGGAAVCITGTPVACTLGYGCGTGACMGIWPCITCAFGGAALGSYGGGEGTCRTVSLLCRLNDLSHSQQRMMCGHDVLDRYGGNAVWPRLCKAPCKDGVRSYCMWKRMSVHA